MKCAAPRFEVIKGQHLTFHIGVKNGGWGLHRDEYEGYNRLSRKMAEAALDRLGGLHLQPLHAQHPSPASLSTNAGSHLRRNRHHPRGRRRRRLHQEGLDGGDSSASPVPVPPPLTSSPSSPDKSNSPVRLTFLSCLREARAATSSKDNSALAVLGASRILQIIAANEHSAAAAAAAATAAAAEADSGPVTTTASSPATAPEKPSAAGASPSAVSAAAAADAVVVDACVRAVLMADKTLIGHATGAGAVDDSPPPTTGAAAGAMVRNSHGNSAPSMGTEGPAARYKRAKGTKVTIACSRLRSQLAVADAFTRQLDRHLNLA